jgi:hypothetical protein
MSAAYFKIRNLTTTGEVFDAKSDDEQAVLRPQLELVHILCEKNALGQDSPVEVTLKITRLPQVGGEHKT